jgi:hypothetical protein
MSAQPSNVILRDRNAPADPNADGRGSSGSLAASGLPRAVSGWPVPDQVFAFHLAAAAVVGFLSMAYGLTGARLGLVMGATVAVIAAEIVNKSAAAYTDQPVGLVTRVWLRCLRILVDQPTEDRPPASGRCPSERCGRWPL